MKKFKFSLSHMMDYRNRILDEEQGSLQKIKGEYDRIQQQIDYMTKMFDVVSSKVNEVQRQGTTMGELQILLTQLGSIRVQLKELDAAQKETAERLERQREVVIEANKEVSKLEKLQDKQSESYRRKVEKADEQRIEELVTVNLGRQSAG